MKKRLIIALAISISSVVLLHAHLDGPPPGHTGAPGEETCAASGCHDGADVASPPGLRFVTFGTYSSEVLIRAILWQGNAGFQTDRPGIQLVVLDPSGNNIGSITEHSGAMQIDTGAGGRVYLSQTETGGIKPIWSGTRIYEFTWTRPSTETDSAIVYAVGLWSNGDSTRLGDAQIVSTLRLYPCPVSKTGDVNESGPLTSADIIYMVNYIFKSGPEPLPCVAVADVNCDGRVNAADIIHFVNILFKIAVPCDVCPLIWDGVWTCE